jgi:hypothetical protein
MRYLKRFNESVSDHKVYTEIKNDFNQEIAELVNYQVVDILDSIPDIHWTIESKIDESKIDDSEQWLELFEEPFVVLYRKPGKFKTLKDSELVKPLNVDLSNYIEKDIFYTAQSNLDRNGREKLKSYLTSKISGIKFLDQDDTPYNVDLVASFSVNNI